MKTLIVLVAVVLAFAAATDLHQQFIEFQHTYGKFYGKDEFNHRYGIFSSNVAKAAKLNAVFETTNFGVTKFMDLTPSEFKTNVLMTNPGPRANQALHYHNQTLKVSRPASFDWRTHAGTVTPVKNQGQCGSCWAFSATENVESQWAIGGHGLHSLSEQQVVDCDTTSYGCNGGWPSHAYEYLIKAGGQDSEQSYPYLARNTPCTFKKADVVAHLRSWAYVTQNKNEEEMANYLVAHGPLSICVDAETWQYYTGGVLKSAACGRSIDHCVEAIGYDTSANPPYWIVRNSWGPDWGERGYIQLEFGKDTCAMAEEVTNSIIS